MVWCKASFDILNRLSVTQESDGRKDGQTDVTKPCTRSLHYCYSAIWSGRCVMCTARVSASCTFTSNRTERNRPTFRTHTVSNCINYYARLEFTGDDSVY